MLKLQTLRSCDSDDAANPGNNLYVTGLSTRVTESDLEKFFSREGKVCFIVYFITSNTLGSANTLDPALWYPLFELIRLIVNGIFRDLI